MRDEGRLSITIRWDGAAITGAQVRSDRGAGAMRVLQGQKVDDALDRVGALYAVCRRSQQAAARLACGFASEAGVESTALAAAELAALAEFAFESLWRVMLDAPALVGCPPRGRELAAIRASLGALADGDHWFAFADELEAALAASVHAMPLAAWRGVSCREWILRRDPLPATVARLLDMPATDFEMRALPWLAEDELAGDIAPALRAHADFASSPSWKGAPAETGSLVRMADHPKVQEVITHPVAARLVGRLVEMAALPCRIRGIAAGDGARWARGTSCGERAGIAAVETARGTLVHAVELDGDRVASWRIVAPTEWNFHPEGAFMRGIAGTPAVDEGAARAAAERLAFALDPCVAADVTVAHA